MTEPDERANEYANQARIARETLDRFERQQARQRRIAQWCLIPYGLAGILIGVGVGKVFDAGQRSVGVLLGVGFIVLMGCQWAMPILIQRESGERKP